MVSQFMCDVQLVYSAHPIIVFWISDFEFALFYSPLSLHRPRIGSSRNGNVNPYKTQQCVKVMVLMSYSAEARDGILNHSAQHITLLTTPPFLYSHHTYSDRRDWLGTFAYQFCSNLYRSVHPFLSLWFHRRRLKSNPLPFVLIFSFIFVFLVLYSICRVQSANFHSLTFHSIISPCQVLFISFVQSGHSVLFFKHANSYSLAYDLDGQNNREVTRHPSSSIAQSAAFFRSSNSRRWWVLWGTHRRVGRGFQTSSDC